MARIPRGGCVRNLFHLSKVSSEIFLTIEALRRDTLSVDADTKLFKSAEVVHVMTWRECVLRGHRGDAVCSQRLVGYTRRSWYHEQNLRV